MKSSWYRRQPAIPGVRAISWLLCLFVAMAVPRQGWLPTGAAITPVLASRLGGDTPGAPQTAVTPDAPQTAVTPDAGPPQTTIMLVGTGFTPGHHLSISYVDMQNPAQSLGSATADVNGSFQVLQLAIPPSAAPGGVGLILVHDASGASTSTPFAVTPLATRLASSSNVATAGGSITISGGGFAPNAAIQLHLIDAAGTVTLQGVTPLTSTTSGQIGPVDVTLPLTPTVTAPSWAVLDAADASGTIAGIPLMLMPVGYPLGGSNTAVRLKPSRAVLGAQVRVAADGFLPGEQIDVSLTGANGISANVPAFQATAAGPSPGTGIPFGAALAADSSGYVEGIFALPVAGEVVFNGTPGTLTSDAGTMLTVTLHGERSGAIRTAPLILSAPHLQAIPSTARPGHPYTLLGSGFAAGEPVHIVTTDSSGKNMLAGHAAATNCGDPGAIAGDTTAPAPAGGGSVCESGTFSTVATAPAQATPAVTPSQDQSPTQAGQNYQVSAIGLTSGLTATSTLFLTSAPTLTLQSYVVAPGESVVVQGNAFVPNATVLVQAAFPSNGTTSCAAGAAAGGTPVAPCPTGMRVATDGNGSFQAQITVPLGLQPGPVAIQAQDDLGDQASVVLTVNSQRPALHLKVLQAVPGQVLTIPGSGFGSGETVDVFLATPSSTGTGSSGAQGRRCQALLLSPIANSTLTSTADAGGSFVVSYPLPRPFDQGTYDLVAVGETSQVCAYYPVLISYQLPTPLPTPNTCGHGQCAPAPTPTPTPIITSCPTTQAGGRLSPCAADTVIYFADGSTAQVSMLVQNSTSYPALPCAASATAPAGTGSARKATAAPASCSSALISYDEELHLLNEGDQPVTVDVEYLIYGLATTQATVTHADPLTSHPSDDWITPADGGKLQLQRLSTFLLRPHATMVRSVNADIGEGHLVSIIVRAAGPVTASTVTRRTVRIVGCAPARPCTCSAVRPCTYALDAAGSDGSGAEGPQTNWLFAQGYDGGAFDEYVSLLNPQTDPTIVQVRVLTPRGPLPPALRLSIPPSGRQSVDVRSAIAALCAPVGRSRRYPAGCPLHQGAIALQISSTEPIVVERALYWGEGSGPSRAGYDVGPGAPAIPIHGGRPVVYPHYLVYASTLHGDQAYLALIDATIDAATVTVSAYSATGMHLADKTIRIPARACATLNLADMVYPGIYSLIIRSTTAVTGELAQYSGGGPQMGAHGGMIEPIAIAPAVARGGTTLLLGAGGFVSTASGQSAADQILVRVFNTGSSRIVARVGMDTPTGEIPLAQYQIAANATLQDTMPAQTDGASLAQPLGVSVSCSGPCVGIVLAVTQERGGSVSAVWGSALR